VISFGFVADNFDELEADFQREYGIDLREALYGEDRVGGRRLTALINGLSPDSATMRKVNSGGRQWGGTEEMLAVLCELTDLSNRMYFAAHFEGEVWEALEIPRPYVEKAAESPLSDPEDLQRFFGTMAMSTDAVIVTPVEDIAVSSTPEEEND